MKKAISVILAALTVIILCFGMCGCDDSKDSDDTESEIKFSKTLKVGDYITFGHYEQDNNIKNGPEEIEWLVLDVKDERALVISKYALEFEEAFQEFKGCWENCYLRRWLNKQFINSAFSYDEQSVILMATLPIDSSIYDCRDRGYYLGTDTRDKIFILSMDEANQYFSSDSARRCKPTAYAIDNVTYYDADDYCWWALRSFNYLHYKFPGANVWSDGEIDNGLVGDMGAIRPAMWIDLDA